MKVFFYLEALQIISFFSENTKKLIMKTPRSYRKFQFQQDKIKNLEEKNPRFKRIYTEFENLSDEIWDIETGDKDSVTDDFMLALQLQTNILEDEIDNWLSLKDEENVE